MYLYSPIIYTIRNIYKAVAGSGRAALPASVIERLNGLVQDRLQPYRATIWAVQSAPLGHSPARSRVPTSLAFRYNASVWFSVLALPVVANLDS